MQPVDDRSRWAQDLANLWHEVVHTPPFVDARIGNWLRTGGLSDLIPQPGFVGRRYEQGGTLLLAMNPGGGAEGDTVHDCRFFEELGRFRASGTDDRLARFLTWNQVFEEVACTWQRYYANLLSPILKRLDGELADVAYLNVLKWRNRSEANKHRYTLYDLSWARHTLAQVAMLKPSKIILLGKGLGKWFVRRITYNQKANRWLIQASAGDLSVEIWTIPRTRGDLRVSDTTSAAIGQLPRSCRQKPLLPEPGNSACVR